MYDVIYVHISIFIVIGYGDARLYDFFFGDSMIYAVTLLCSLLILLVSDNFRSAQELSLSLMYIYVYEKRNN